MATGLERRTGDGMTLHEGWERIAPTRRWRWLTPAAVVIVVGVVAAVMGVPRDETETPDSLVIEHDSGPGGVWPQASHPSVSTMDGVVLAPEVTAKIDRKVGSWYPRLRAILVAVGGELAVERYYGEVSPGDHADVSSVTKSVVSMLVGIAVDEGVIAGVDQTVGELLPRHISGRTTPEVAGITLEQLLTMTSGLPPSGVNSPPAFTESDDWARGILDRGTFVPPGTMFSDSDAAAHLLSVIVTEAAGRSALAYAQENLFAPLGISTKQPATAAPEPRDGAVAAHETEGFAWPRDPQGYHLGFAGLRLTPADMIKLGQLYLQQGRWDRRQVVPLEYVRASTRPSDIRGASRAFGYEWWLSGLGGHEAFDARGRGGQLIQVVPALDLVVVASSDVAEDGQGDHLHELRSLIVNDVFPALASSSPRRSR